VFRDKQGRVGALDPHCAHRGTSLEWGQVEEAGLRCCYHGWLYDTRGRCIDMPCESEEFRPAHGCLASGYPTLEYGGLVFVYMVPPGTEPCSRGTTSSTPTAAMMSCCVACGCGGITGRHGQGLQLAEHYEKSSILAPDHGCHQATSGDQFEGA